MVRTCKLELRHVAGVLAVVAAVVGRGAISLTTRLPSCSTKNLHAQHAHVLQAFCYRFCSGYRLLASAGGRFPS